MTLILKTSSTSPDPNILRRAAEILKRGGVVAFPTETVYGLGAVVYNEDAVRKVYIAKMRPFDNPLIVHISRESMLEEVAIKIPEKAYRLINKFWPGPLTLILPRNPNIPRIVTGGLDVIAARMPAHPVALRLIEEVGSPIAAPSANLAGRPSPTTAEHVIRDLYGRIDAVIDAGETLYGVESTILNILTDPPTLLRPGAYPVEEIERALGENIYIPPFARGFVEAERALAPGMKYRHYAPETPLLLVEPRSGDLGAMVSIIRSLVLERLGVEKKICIVASAETVNRYRDLPVELLVIGSRRNMFEVAKNLFKTLRRLDDLNCTIGIVEGFEERGLGLTVMNRLRKASETKIPV